MGGVARKGERASVVSLLGLFFSDSALGFESCSFRVWDCSASVCWFRGLGDLLAVREG